MEELIYEGLDAYLTSGHYTSRTLQVNRGKEQGRDCFARPSSYGSLYSCRGALINLLAGRGMTYSLGVRQDSSGHTLKKSTVTSPSAFVL
jgi:hypothetical protein